jgi:hypothetical protein
MLGETFERVQVRSSLNLHNRKWNWSDSIIYGKLLRFTVYEFTENVSTAFGAPSRALTGDQVERS